MTDPLQSFFVPMVPPKATAQQKGVSVKSGRPRFFKKKSVRASESEYYAALLPHRPARPHAGPLAVELLLVFPWRKSDGKAVRSGFAAIPHAVRPDCDNLSKTILDCATKAGFFGDDAQISDLRVRKFFGAEAGLGLVVRRAEGIPAGGILPHALPAPLPRR
jgi:Holliday junction resolvase RusA-like endonuclease